LILCERIAAGRPISHVAREMGISRQRASIWWHRYVAEGEAGLVDRRSIPVTPPANQLPVRTVRRIISLRVNRRWGPARIAGHLRLVASTVWRILHRHGLSRLRHLDPPTSRPIRYEKQIPGELVHVDVKKFGKIPAGGGWRLHGKGNVVRTRKVGHTFLHEAVDDYSRVAYAEFCDDETAITSLGFMMRARQWFADRGITIQAVMTDNGSAYVSQIWADTLESVNIDHFRIRPRRPQTNGKVERFGRTLATEWAYANAWMSDQSRAEDLPRWLHSYNHHRYHTAINGTPTSRVNNLRDQYS
jgi:transposase InsO family protein